MVFARIQLGRIPIMKKLTIELSRKEMWELFMSLSIRLNSSQLHREKKRDVIVIRKLRAKLDQSLDKYKS